MASAFPILWLRILQSRMLTGALIVLGGLVALWRLFGAVYSDSWAPMMAALEFLGGPAPDALYETVFFERGIKFQYPPSSLLYVDLLRAVGIYSVAAFNLLNWFLFVINALLCSALAAKLFSAPHWRPYRPLICATAFVCALAFFPSFISYRAGQIQVLINLLFTGACVALAHGVGFVAGALTGVATAIKPQLAPYVVLGLLRRQGKFAGAMVLSVGASVLASVALYGLPNHLSYLQVLQFLTQRGESYYWNNSVNGIAHRFLGNGSSTEVIMTSGIWHSQFPPFNHDVYLATLAAGALFTSLPFVMALVLPRKPDDPVGNLLLFAVAGLSFVLASPIAWVHHYGVLLPVYLVLLRCILDRSAPAASRWPLRLFGVSFALTAFEFPRPYAIGGWETLLYAPTFFGACIALALLVGELLAWRGGPPAEVARAPASF